MLPRSLAPYHGSRATNHLLPRPTHPLPPSPRTRPSIHPANQRPATQRSRRSTPRVNYAVEHLAVDEDESECLWKTPSPSSERVRERGSSDGSNCYVNEGLKWSHGYHIPVEQSSLVEPSQILCLVQYIKQWTYTPRDDSVH
jgi:hypothetical protein